MDRKIVYPGSIPLETDLLLTNKNAMLGIGLLAESILGTSTQYYGLDVHPTAVPSLAVSVHRGVVYQQLATDAAAFSSLPADPTPLVKQGALLSAVTLNVVAPATPGYAVNYLIQAMASDVDSDAAVLPYYNASNPTQAFAGPGNGGMAQPTTRKCVATVSALAGAAAPAGSQTTPAPSAGYIGIAVVTVNYGDTAINAAAIKDFPGTPRIGGAVSYAPIDSPHLTGIPTAPTAPAGTDNAQLATTHFVHDAIANGVGAGTAGLATQGYVDQAVANVEAQIGQGFDASLTQNGYQKLPGGLILQWGISTQNSDVVVVTFPIPFPNACLNVQATGTSTATGSQENVKATLFTKNNFTLRSYGLERPANWFAIGF